MRRLAAIVLQRSLGLWLGMWMLAGSATAILTSWADDETSQSRVDPAAWGSDHVGQPLPDYMTGDECLFCHRDIGNTWQENAHQLTIRPATPDDPALQALSQHPETSEFADDVEFLLGRNQMVRYLARSDEYGKLRMQTVTCRPGSDETRELTIPAAPQWDEELFGNRCAGCHATAVITETRAFSATSLDCCCCHGDVDRQHANDTSLVLLSQQNREPRQVVSICGQCHLRGGTSRSSELPYPNTFVAGDNLFREFAVDFSDDAIAARPPIDRHIFENARDVVLFERADVDCLSCHSVHSTGTERHQLLGASTSCDTCHVAGSDHSQLVKELQPDNRRRVPNSTCQY